MIAVWVGQALAIGLVGLSQKPPKAFMLNICAIRRSDGFSDRSQFVYPLFSFFKVVFFAPATVKTYFRHIYASSAGREEDTGRGVENMELVVLLCSVCSARVFFR
jgi:hypothetical protein